MRRGQTGQVHNAMFNFGTVLRREPQILPTCATRESHFFSLYSAGPNGKLEWSFDGGDLLKGETDGSSYMNGGMRATHTAGGYTALDPSSPMFIRNDTLYIPTVFVSFYGKALDEKTPLLRSMEAVSKAGTRLLGLLGLEAKTVKPMIGLEQEFFLIPREAYYKRPDLQLAGRTVMGAFPARGQELSDHYMAPLNSAALACMREMQHEAFKMGIPLNTRHREVRGALLVVPSCCDHPVFMTVTHKLIRVCSGGPQPVRVRAVLWGRNNADRRELDGDGAHGGDRC